MIKNISFLFLILLFIGCAGLAGRAIQVNFPVQDLKDIKVYNILLHCDKDKVMPLPISVCEGSIKSGVVSCDNIKEVTCADIKDGVLITGFNSIGWGAIDSYFQYLYERIK